MSMLKHKIASLAMAVTCSAASLAGSSIWEPWKEVKIPVGNDKDGFVDTKYGYIPVGRK